MRCSTVLSPKSLRLGEWRVRRPACSPGPGAPAASPIKSGPEDRNPAKNRVASAQGSSTAPAIAIPTQELSPHEKRPPPCGAASPPGKGTAKPRRRPIGRSELHPFLGATGLKRRFASLVVADANGFFHAADKDLSVANATGARGADNGLHRLLFHVVRDNQFYLDLGQKVHCVFTAAIKLGVALLPAMPASLQNRHAFDACLEQCILDRIQLRGLEYRFNFDHHRLPRVKMPRLDRKSTRLNSSH